MNIVIAKSATNATIPRRKAYGQPAQTPLNRFVVGLLDNKLYNKSK